MSYNILYLRKKIRFYTRILRQSLSVKEQYKCAITISKLAFNYKFIYKSKKIGFFLSFDGELNTYPLIYKLWLNKNKVYVPIVDSYVQKSLLFVQFTPYSHLNFNKYNILEPIFSSHHIISPFELDIVFVPLVAFDNTGARLGMGGGFYDYFLQTYKNTKLIPIGFAYNCQLVEYIPTFLHDISLPMILTPKKLWLFNK